MTTSGKPPPYDPPTLTGIPQLDINDEDDEEEIREVTRHITTTPDQHVETAQKPFLVVLRGKTVGQMYELTDGDFTIGRSPEATIQLDEQGVSRVHVTLSRRGENFFVLKDMKSSNGTFVNTKRVDLHRLANGDRIAVGGHTIFKFELLDADAEAATRELLEASMTRRSTTVTRPWSPDSWKKMPAAQAVAYEDPAQLEVAVGKLRRLPPLVTSWEIEELKSLIAEAQEGRRFLLQGGDCAETLDDCESSIITNKLKILLHMSLVLIYGAHRPIIRVGRFAGQYAKPRSSPTETRDGVTLPSYLGDLVNHPEFTPAARRADPQLLLECYQRASLTLNFIRALSGGGFADLRRPEYYDLSFFDRAELPSHLREEYQRMGNQISEGLHFVKALGEGAVDELTRVPLFTSHDALNLIYESAQTRQVPRRTGWYDLTTHLPWIGERTRALTGAHIEFFRGIANPVGVKLGPAATPEETVALTRALNPLNEPGKLLLIVRMGAANVETKLPLLIDAVKKSKQRVLWVSDPMHGNTRVTKSGVKTRNFDDIIKEVELSLDIHTQCGTYFGGVHFELTGEDVTECVGAGLSEEDLNRNYLTACDPRLNYRQAVEMAFRIARHMASATRVPAPSTMPPPSANWR
ncbi:MAG: 2-keto-3-deoxy-D-arabino-heptulosonate-7-phosphate synthase [Myxococcaceae bacterium]|nr:2-keto-3-deoxy-D-arabino-heptulosonate-7-phosphate synthase [Myxococcaceae bacterium]